MSLDELREQNKQLVTEKALELFIKNGIAATKIKDIAKAAGVTERSVFRYFPTKTDIVQAAAYHYWWVAQDEAFGGAVSGDLTGIEQIRAYLRMYCDYFLKYPGGARFTVDAEIAFYVAGRNDIRRPPDPYENSERLLVKAIKKGLTDGTVDPGCDPRELYYNCYDAILGVLQRIARDATGPEMLDNKKRMRSLCDMFAARFAGEKR